MNFESYTDRVFALHAMTERLKGLIDMRETQYFTLALSGGGTAKEMFSYWTQEYSKKITWRSIRFFWVDERCVPPDSDESNYRHANELFLKPLGIAEKNIFRIHGESDPEQEAQRYTQIARKITKSESSLPDFDCTILGMGEDGHTASIFPADLKLLDHASAYAVATHPQSGQKRITMTGYSILNSHAIFLPVLGESKAPILEKAVVEAKSDNITLPSAYMMRNSENLTLFTDALKMQISG